MSKKIRNLKYSQSGFTLVEVIMSIGILAVVSIFVMQMYIKAGSLKEMVFDKDYALAAAQAAVEVYKANGPDLSDLLEANFVYQEYAHLLPADDTDNDIMQCFFDEQWNPVSSETLKGYTLTLEIAPFDNQTPYGRLLKATVSVVRNYPYMLENDDTQLLCSLESLTYFSE
ncbi:MAG: prepilin-type N-terminal cleavage/methylation domain-containing protein [Syntrophomonadaceae bacterium]|jgi:prepilin-type N-terminal cleavage/methylation domain-containing protein|nr:prepilin-type N-terminal cleavage/methylation domain-containing protein [Syntrophomonadaceae bacterium]